MGIRLEGKKVAEKFREDLKILIEERLKKGQRPPCLANILVGEDGGSVYYVNSQNTLCEKMGVSVKSINFNSGVEEIKLIELIEQLNNDENVDGIILQLPLPKHIDESKVTSMISYEKDIDGLSSISIGKLYKGEKCFYPCTPKGVIEMIKSTGESIEGKSAVIVGRSNIVGKPVAQLLLNENATVTICHSKTINLKGICKNADILISAMGKPGFITKDYIKKDAIVIDVGTTSVDGKLKGDVCYDEAIEIAKYITPVPGGVGTMTTTMLIKNLCEGLK